jgi:CheY-like chemotaxis protein
MMTRERLALRGEKVTTAISMKNTSFDAVILDLQMPEMDGLQALEKLTAMNPDKPIIILKCTIRNIPSIIQLRASSCLAQLFKSLQ